MALELSTTFAIYTLLSTEPRMPNLVANIQDKTVARKSSSIGRFYVCAGGA